MFYSGSILLGQYRPLDSFLHRLDARAKIIVVLIVMVLGLLTESLSFYLIILGALITGLLVSGVGPGRLLLCFRPILILVAITFLYHIVFSGRETNVVWSLGGLDITSGGLRSASFFSVRLVLFLTVAFLITLTSSPSDLAEAATRFMSPLGRIRMPVNDLGLILYIALRFIPILYDEFTAIKQAQMIRGVRFTGSLVYRIRRIASLMVPVFVTAVGRADELATAIEARGYRSDRPRTSYSYTVFGVTEWLFLLATCVALGLLYYGTL